ncbi:MAG: short-subunit dehydrogenase [Cellvibrionaceae bacterium]|jgi:short-subunit dehydrogenase
MRNILITGATSGIGLELARIYQKQSGSQKEARLILVGRRSLSALSDPIFSKDNYCQTDLAQSAGHLAIEEWLAHQQISSLDLIIHNAGIGWTGSLADQSPASMAEIMQVNLKAPIAITHTLFQHLVRANGKVVFVSSVASALPTADFATYTASKAALDGFARSLAVEAKGRFAVQILHPGATRTEMHAKIGMEPEKYEKFRPADQVALEMVGAIQRNKRNIAIGFSNKLLRWVGRTFPRLLEQIMRKKSTDQAADIGTGELHILVTGGADGIGAAIARRFAGAGNRNTHMTIVDIDSGRGEALAAELGNRAVFVKADLSNLESIQTAADTIGKLPPITVLVNNAGISAAGHFESLALTAQLNVIDINLTGALILTTTLLRQNRLAAGHMQVYLSSLSKYVGYPGAAVYSGSKDGLASFASSIQAAAPIGGRSLTVYPGPTRTAHAHRYSPDNSREEKRMPPEEVAEQVVQSVVKGKRNLFPGGGAKTFAVFGRLLPRVAEQAMKKTIYDKLA